MQIVIDITDSTITDLKKKQNRTEVDNAVLNGILLPKGHGRILDEKEILNTEKHDGGWYDLVDLPEYIAGVSAIVEADKGEQE